MTELTVKVHGSPVTMTILGADPLALLFAFKIVSPHTENLELSEEYEQLVEDGFAEVSLADGTAWLTFYNLSEETSDSIQGTRRDFCRRAVGGRAHLASRMHLMRPDGRRATCICGGHLHSNLPHMRRETR